MFSGESGIRFRVPHGPGPARSLGPVSAPVPATVPAACRWRLSRLPGCGAGDATRFGAAGSGPRSVLRFMTI